MFIDDDGERAMVLSHLFEGFKNLHGLGQNEGLANLPFNLRDIRQGDPEAPSTIGTTKEVVDEQNAVHVIEVFGGDGECGVARLSHRFGDLLGCDGVFEIHHINARRHHVTELELRGLVNAANDGLFELCGGARLGFRAEAIPQTRAGSIRRLRVGH
jgi:hypothetical protein